MREFPQDLQIDGLVGVATVHENPPTDPVHVELHPMKVGPSSHQSVVVLTPIPSPQIGTMREPPQPETSRGVYPVSV